MQSVFRFVYRVRLFYPDRIAYHAGIGARLLIAFLHRVSVPDRLLGGSPSTRPLLIVAHGGISHWLPRIMLDGANYRGLYASESRPQGLAIACSARVDAAAPSDGMVVVRAAWGMPVAVMVQVRVRT
jgi:hypothetical protein